jgi:hypothetical protein
VCGSLANRAQRWNCAIPGNDDANAVAIDVTPDFTVVLLLNYP